MRRALHRASLRVANPRRVWRSSRVGLTGALAMLAAACAPRPSRPSALDLQTRAAAVSSHGVTLPPPSSTPAVDLHVLIGGDLLPHRPMLLPVDRLREGLAPLDALLARADVAVANYESATGDTGRPLGQHGMLLAAGGAWLAEAGRHFHAVTIANNHACDLGRPGLSATLAAADHASMIALGGDAQGDPWQPRVVDQRDGRTVCAVAWTTFVNSDGKACKASGELALAGFDRPGKLAIDAALTRARKSGCDGIIAIFHGGQEYKGPIWGVREQAKVAADAGADAVVVHHPHVPAPVVVLVARDGRKVPVFESVGNLLSNQGESYEPANFPVSKKNLIAMNAWTRLGVLADLSWSWPADALPHERPSFRYGYHLTWTENDHLRNRADPMPHISTRPLDPVSDRGLIQRLERDPGGPLRLFTDPCWIEGSGARCVIEDGKSVAPAFM